MGGDRRVENKRKRETKDVRVREKVHSVLKDKYCFPKTVFFLVRCHHNTSFYSLAVRKKKNLAGNSLVQSVFFSLSSVKLISRSLRLASTATQSETEDG